MNALSTLVNRAFKDKSISRASFIQKAGYKNINKGLRRFDAFLDEPKLDSPFFSDISNILEVPGNTLKASIKEVWQAIEEQERKEFKPFILVKLDRRPSPIFVAAMIPGLTQIRVPESIAELSYEQEISVITELYRKHRDEYSPGWPAGNGFCYYRRYDESLHFNREGDLIKNESCSPYSFRIRI